MSTPVAYVESLPRRRTGPGGFGRVFAFLKLLHEAYLEAVAMAREAHRRYPHLG
jgi:hypothetical protein